MDKSKHDHKHGQSIDRAFLFSLMQSPNTILLESSRPDDHNHRNLLFHSPIEVLTTSDLNTIPEIFARIETHLHEGRWIAGYVGYECGYHFEKIIPSFNNERPLPLMWFGVYQTPIKIDPAFLNSISSNQHSGIRNASMTISEEAYRLKIEQLKRYIINGDTYQVNFTDRFEFNSFGTPHEFYFDLRQKQHVPFGAFINLGEHQILSFSPELFFRTAGRSIVTKPMKGTCPRGRTTEEDLQLSAWLQGDEKNRSENLMIVDLLRNDIGRICTNGSVEVKEMYAVETYETVLQMTSTVMGTLQDEVRHYEIFKSLFPCGSVTGAPKIRTMQIISELEQKQRGTYCGAIGFMSPENESVFNVAIRTIELNGNTGVMGVGSGIVYDSDAGSEFEECKLKAAFLLSERTDFDLLETILWKNGYTFLQQHLERLMNSAHYFQLDFDSGHVLDALTISERSFNAGTAYRVRLLLTRSGEPIVESVKIDTLSMAGTVKIAPEQTNPHDRFLFHKTTHRKMYDRYRKKAQEEHLADFIFLNQLEEITEGSVTNIFIEKNGILYTPPVSCGVLPGIYRGEVLKTNPQSREKVLKMNDLLTADVIYICNSVRGWNKVTLSV